MVLLRAERSSGGPSRVYSLTYAARDASGNTASALGVVTVPHDLGSGPEPLIIHVEPGGAAGTAHVYWNAAPGADTYDLIQGDLGQVGARDGTLWLGSVRVLTSGSSSTTFNDAGAAAIPARGRVSFYLVQYRNAQGPSGWGTESGPWAAEPSSCDPACPGAPGGGETRMRAR